MRNRSLKLYKAGMAFGILSIIFTVIVLLVDVQPIGPEGSRIGLAKLNGAVFDATGFDENWYDISDIFGKIQLLVIAVFGCMGAVQLVKNKSLMKVDKRIRALGVFYVIVGIIYVAFTFIAVNYRPVILDEGLEPSYPSSHTLMACCVMGSAIIMINEMIESKAPRKLLQAICAVLLVLSVLSRLLSGVHWITDIIIGILMSLALVFWFAGIIQRQKESSRGLKFYD